MLPKSDKIFIAIIAPASITFKAVLPDSRMPTIAELLNWIFVSFLDCFDFLTVVARVSDEFYPLVSLT